MPVLDDVTTYLHALGLVTPAVDIFHTTKASIPSGNGPYTLLVETGGSGGERTHNLDSISYEMPTFQAEVTASTGAVARSKLMALHDALVLVKNRLLGTTWYVSIAALQSTPIDMGQDDLKRQKYTLNFLAMKRPS